MEHPGRCTCGAARYRLTDRPLFTHACHCSWCQRETGTAFALNAMIESDRLTHEGRVEEVVLPTASGKGQVVMRCAACKVALWSHYSGAGRRMAFVRVGTLERPGECPPDIHIYTTTKLPWVVLDGRVPAVPEFYRRSQMWPDWALKRFEAMRA